MVCFGCVKIMQILKAGLLLVMDARRIEPGL